MPKQRQFEKCKHPNSRKTRALAKHIKKSSARDKAKLSGNIKLNLLGEKIIWFKEHIAEDVTICTPNLVSELIQQYIQRFDEELEQIKLKHSIGNRKNRQHANREDIINLTVKRELEEFNTCGLEIPDILNNIQLNLLKSWTGELRFIQNFRLRRFSRKNLQEEEAKLLQKSAILKPSDILNKIKENVVMDVDSQ